MICTKDDDEDELKHPDISKCIENNTLNEEYGFFEEPVKALLNWNKNRAMEMIDIYNEYKGK